MGFYTMMCIGEPGLAAELFERGRTNLTGERDFLNYQYIVQPWNIKNILIKISQNQKMVEMKRDLWRSSHPVSLL